MQARSKQALCFGEGLWAGQPVVGLNGAHRSWVGRPHEEACTGAEAGRLEEACTSQESDIHLRRYPPGCPASSSAPPPRCPRRQKRVGEWQPGRLAGRASGQAFTVTPSASQYTWRGLLPSTKGVCCKVMAGDFLSLSYGREQRLGTVATSPCPFPPGNLCWGSGAGPSPPREPGVPAHQPWRRPGLACRPGVDTLVDVPRKRPWCVSGLQKGMRSSGSVKLLATWPWQGPPQSRLLTPRGTPRGCWRLREAADEEASPCPQSEPWRTWARGAARLHRQKPRRPQG